MQMIDMNNETSRDYRTITSLENNHVIIESTITSLKLFYKCFMFHLQHFLSFNSENLKGKNIY